MSISLESLSLDHFSALLNALCHFRMPFIRRMIDILSAPLQRILEGHDISSRFKFELCSLEELHSTTFDSEELLELCHIQM